MAWFSKGQVSIFIKIKLDIANFGYFKKLENIRLQLDKSWNICNKNVKFEVENFEHLRSNTGVI